MTTDLLLYGPRLLVIGLGVFVLWGMVDFIIRNRHL